jgi:hypothetical protein
VEVVEAATSPGRQRFVLHQFGTGTVSQFRRAYDQGDRASPTGQRWLGGVQVVNGGPAGGQLPSFALGRLRVGPRTGVADHRRARLGTGATVWLTADCGEIQKMTSAERPRGESRRRADFAGCVASDGMRSERSGVGQSHFAIVPRGRANRN